MPAYLLNFVRGISDMEAVQKYWKDAPATFLGNAKRLACYTPFEILEGDIPVWGVVALEWPSMEEARKWYYGPEYTKMKKVREGAQDNICILVEGGFVPAEHRAPPPDYTGQPAKTGK